MIPFATMTERFAVRSTTKMNSSKSSSRKNARGTKGTQWKNSNRLPYLTSLGKNNIYSTNSFITNSYNKKTYKSHRLIVYKNIYNNTFFNTPKISQQAIPAPRIVPRFAARASPTRFTRTALILFSIKNKWSEATYQILYFSFISCYFLL